MKTQDFDFSVQVFYGKDHFKFFVRVSSCLLASLCGVTVPAVQASRLLYFCGVKSVCLLQHLSVLLIGSS